MRCLSKQTADMAYCVDLEEYKKKKAEFDEEWSKAYALIYHSYCSTEMKVAVKELPTYKSMFRDNVGNISLVRTKY